MEHILIVIRFEYSTYAHSALAPPILVREMRFIRLI